MRILNVTETYAPFLEFGGPPVKVRALSEGLGRRGHQVTVLTADWGLEKKMQTEEGKIAAERSPFGWRREKNGVQAIYLADMCGDGLTDLVRVRNADFRIRSIASLTRELERDHACDIALQRQHLKVEHQPCVVGIRSGHSDGAIQIGQCVVLRIGFGLLDAPLDFANTLHVAAHPCAIRRPQLTPQTCEILGHGIEQTRPFL